MRILYDSKQPQFKTPFGTLTPGQECTISIQIPSTVRSTRVQLELFHQDHAPYRPYDMEFRMKKGAYDFYQVKFSIPQRGLYFYHFRIHNREGSFRLYKQGDDTNMEAGELWQLSVVPEDFVTPDWAKGATIYQLFPDRFYSAGRVETKGKLQPFVLHKNWHEEVFWQPTPEGIVLNNDFYGGNFRGILEKMDYLQDLGVTLLYLNPISKSFSSHRYDTGDYKTPDPMLGTEAEFAALCRAAHDRGMKVILDGVYSHTGSNSLYFNREGAFPGKGAYQSVDSPYHSWYQFHRWPDSYNSWWGFDTLPTINKMDPKFIEYIITGEDSVIAHWLKLGCDGFRLDVADELPDEFLAIFRRRLKELNPDALLLAEVWEDASNKVAYGQRRRYFVDGELDSVMNYPFRTAILNFVRGRDSGRGLKDTVMSIAENYPEQVLHCNMNHLGTHDTPRVLTALVDDFEGSREAQALRRLSRNQLEVARERLLMASFLQYALPGSPSIYYGDEALMEGHKDPFNRRPFPWGREDWELQNHFRRLGRLRKSCEPLRLGDIRFFLAEDKHLGFKRSYQGKTVRVYCNRSGDAWEVAPGNVVFGYSLQAIAPDCLIIGPRGFCVVEE